MNNTWKIDDCREKFLSWLDSYVEQKYTLGNISQETYEKIQSSIQDEDFSKFLFLYIIVEGTEIAIESVAYAVIVIISIDSMEEYYTNLAYFVAWNMVLKWIYSYFIAKAVWFPEPVRFSLFNSLPLGNFYTPTRWLSVDDIPAITQSIKMIQRKVSDSVKMLCIDHPISQNIMRILH